MLSNENKDNCHCMDLQFFVYYVCIESQNQSEKILKSSEKLILKQSFLKMRVFMLFKPKPFLLHGFAIFIAAF